jgi:hypothetical protein
MEPIFIDDGLDPGQFGDLMDQGLGVLASEPPATAPAGRRLAVEGLADLLRWDQGAARLAMSGLAAAVLAGRRSRGLALQSDRIGRGGLGGVGRVELEPRLEVMDPGFQLLDPLPHRQEHGGDGRLCLGRDLGPEFVGDRRRVDHDDGIADSSATFNAGL